MKSFDITRHKTSCYHPQTNSACERQNSVIAQSLRAFCESHPEKWPKYLPSVIMAFRKFPCNQSSEFAPFYLMFGDDMQLPFDTSVIPKESLAPDAKQYLKHILENLKDSQEVSSENEKHFQQRNKARYDQKQQNSRFSNWR